MTQSGFWTRLICAAAVAAICLPAGASRAEQLEPLQLSYPQSNSQYWNFDVAIEKGFFRDEKFAPVNTTGIATPQALQMLITGDVVISSPQPDALLIAIARGGKELALFAQPELRPDWLLVGSAKTKTVKDVKGGNLGLSALKGTEQRLAEEVFMKHGLKKGDWTPIVVGITPVKFAALTKGSVAAAILYQPTGQVALKQGLPLLAKISDLGDNVSGYYTINRTWAATNDHGKRVARALMRAHDWLYDPKNRKEAIGILQKYTKRSPEVLDKVYEQFFVTDKLYARKPLVRKASLKNAIADVVKRGDIPKGALTPEAIILPEKFGGMHD